VTNDAALLTGTLADRSAWRAKCCPIDKAMQVIGTRSAMLIMREAYYGTTRFDDFADRVGITEAVAAARLRELVDTGLLERRPYKEPGQRTRFEYRLTDKGRDLMPVVLGLFEWGAKHVLPGGRASIELSHANCGALVQVEVRCADGHDVPLEQLVISKAERARSTTASSRQRRSS
jgi:DNA-binding HxlR family transcriptional regulator